MIELPLELERDIFEISARLEPAMARSLVLVADRVRQWIDPILYETVTLNDKTSALRFLHATDVRPVRANHVKTLCIQASVGYAQAQRILTLCASIKNLACWLYEPRLRPFLTPKRLGRLSFMPSGLSYDTEPSTPDFSDPFYQHITHLHFTDRWASWVTWDHFDLLPRLTHLALFYDDTALSDDMKVATKIRSILTACHSSLQVCVLLYVMPPMSNAFAMIEDEDARFVFVRTPRDAQANWEGFTRGTPDMWTVAEEVVKARRRRSIEERTETMCDETVDVDSPWQRASALIRN